MENIQLNSNNITRKQLIYPVSSPDIATHAKGEETNAVTMVLISLGMVALTIAVIIKVASMLVKSVINVFRNHCSWLYLQH